MTLAARKVAHYPGAEVVEQATDFLKNNSRVALGVLGAVALAGVFLILSMRSRAAAESEAAGQLAEANALYWQGQYQQSLTMARQIGQAHGSTPSGIEAHRLAGDNAYWSGDYKTAISEYRAYLGRQKKGLMADAATRSLAYALESDKQFQEAAKSYESLIGRFDRESSAEFLAAAARCYRGLNQNAEAIKSLQRLVNELGETSFSHLARIEIAELSATH